jgi:HK97 family phage major capsid protein
MYGTSQFAFSATAGAVRIGGVPAPAVGELYGKPVFVDENLPAIAASTAVIAVGDPEYYALVEKARGLQVLRDQYSSAASGQVVFHCNFRQGGTVLAEEAWVLGQTTA